MEAAISCKFRCTRLEEHWRGGGRNRRLELYAEAARDGPRQSEEWTRIRANAEAQEVDDPASAAALRRLADALG